MIHGLNINRFLFILLFRLLERFGEFKFKMLVKFRNSFIIYITQFEILSYDSIGFDIQVLILIYWLNVLNIHINGFQIEFEINVVAY